MLNFLSIIGKKCQGSALDDLLIEFGVYAARTTSAFMAGCSYNRGVRAHKLCLEAFFRLLWKRFLTRCAGIEQAIRLKNGTRAIEEFESLQEELKDVMKQFKEFKEEQRASSKLFAY